MPPKATPLTAVVVVLPLVSVVVTLRKLCAGVPKNEFVKAPPVAGLTAMVQPEAPAEKHIVAAAAGGIVVLTMNAPSSIDGLNVTCS